MRKIILALLIWSWAVSPVFADMTAISMGQARFQGSGCPKGSVSATPSPDGSALSVIFDRYVVEAGKSVHRRSHAKQCHVKVPLRAPAGYSVALVRADYRGFNSLPSGALTILKTREALVSDGRSVESSLRRSYFSGPIDEEYLTSDSVAGLVSTKCGGAVDLILSSHLQVYTNRWKEQALATVDSLDLTAGKGEGHATFHLKLRRCRQIGKKR